MGRLPPAVRGEAVQDRELRLGLAVAGELPVRLRVVVQQGLPFPRRVPRRLVVRRVALGVDRAGSLVWAQLGQRRAQVHQDDQHLLVGGSDVFGKLPAVPCGAARSDAALALRRIKRCRHRAFPKATG